MVRSMVYNWRRFALNELFLACGLGHATEREQALVRRFGPWIVPAARRACLAYLAKTSQITEIAARLPHDRLRVVDYNDLVRHRDQTLANLFEFIGEPYRASYGAGLHDSSVGSIGRPDGPRQVADRVGLRSRVPGRSRGLSRTARKRREPEPACMMNPSEGPIRVLALASDRYPPFRVDVSVLFGQCLPRLGVLSDWVMQAEDRHERERDVPWGGGTIRVGRTHAGTTRLGRLWKHVLGLANDLRVLRRSDLRTYDIIQVKDKVVAALPAICCARRAGKAFVYWLSFPNPEASTYVAQQGAARYPWLYRLRGWLLFRLLYRVILPRCDHVFVQSEQMKRDLMGYGLDGETMSAVPMGVLMSDFASIEPQPHVGGPVVCYLGTLAAERRLDFLVRCLAIIRENHPDARMLFVGGAERSADLDLITGEAKRLGIANAVEITGFLPRYDALRHVAAATVCVSPFRPSPILDSTSPTKLVEYMALGRPVVANDHPEQSLVIGESGGGICVPYEERAFAAAVGELLADRSRAEERGRRGLAYVREFRDYPQIAQAVAETYREIAASHAAGRVARVGTRVGLAGRARQP